MITLDWVYVFAGMVFAAITLVLSMIGDPHGRDIVLEPYPLVGLGVLQLPGYAQRLLLLLLLFLSLVERQRHSSGRDGLVPYHHIELIFHVRRHKRKPYGLVQGRR